jgi:hypothetical protein
VLPPADSDAVEMAMTPDWKLAPEPLPSDTTVVVVPVPVPVPVVPVLPAPVIVWEPLPQPVDSAAATQAMIHNLRMYFILARLMVEVRDQ